MNFRSRLLVVIASLSLILMYFFPMWSISLDAPQYPEGLGLKIYIHTIVGATEYDLQNINGLNHYIGMKRIEPDSIQELRLMPYIIGVMMVLGILFAWWGKRFAVISWIAAFIILGIVGTIDFYLWEYDYGHNLDPTAAIKIPGMSYQPPLLGSKQLLNFTAHSYPDIAGYVVGFSILLAAFAVFIVDKQKKSSVGKEATLDDTKSQNGTAEQNTTSFLPLSGFLLMCMLAMTACNPQPQAIDYGKEECAHCKMAISDKRFSAQLLTVKSKAYKFDAIECMAAFVGDNKVGASDIHSLWVADYSGSSEFLPAKKSFYLRSENIQSPMGLNIAAFPSEKVYKQHQKQYGGDLYYWDSVRLLVVKQWSK